MPFLSHISFPPSQDGSYLQHIPSLSKGLELDLTSNVTFFVGENGSGKLLPMSGPKHWRHTHITTWRNMQGK